MRIILDSTTQLLELAGDDHARARLWEGNLWPSGVAVYAVIVLVAPVNEADAVAFRRALEQPHKAPTLAEGAMVNGAQAVL
jgi:hypothetical protein